MPEILELSPRKIKWLTGVLNVIVGVTCMAGASHVKDQAAEKTTGLAIESTIPPLEQQLGALVIPSDSLPGVIPVVEPEPNSTAVIAAIDLPALSVPPPEPQPPVGTKAEWMAEAGIAEEDLPYVDYIMNFESTWAPGEVNSSSCIGLGQNCPDEGYLWLEASCPNWESDPVCQIRRFTQYATERYGSWQEAYQFSVANGWW